MNVFAQNHAETVTARRSRPAVTLEGFADLWIVFEYVDASFARTLLPDYLRLGTPPPGTPTGAHLMMHSFGTQTVRLRGLRWIPLTYHESILGVCYVEPRQHASHAGPHSVMTSASTNRLLPMLLGRLIGYPKSFTRNLVTERSFCMRTFLTGRALMFGRFEATGDLSEAPGSPALAISEPILRHPVISRTPWGTVLASRFELKRDTWLFAPVESVTNVTSASLVGLPPGNHSWHGIDNTGVGAFRSQHHWHLSWPVKVG
jgi:hypothetical protein